MESSWSVAGLNDFGFTSNTLNGKRWGSGADAQFHIDRLDVWAEYLYAEYRPLNSAPSREVDAEGWYTQAAYFIFPKKLQAIVKYDMFDPNTHLTNTTTDTWTLGANYYLKGDDLIRIQTVF